MGPEFAHVRAAYDNVYNDGPLRRHATSEEADDAFEAEYIARQARIEADRSECSLSPPPPTAPLPLYIYDTDVDDDEAAAAAAPHNDEAVAAAQPPRAQPPHNNDREAVTGARHAANYQALRSGRACYDDDVARRVAAFHRVHATFCARVLPRAWPCAGCVKALRGAARHTYEGRALITYGEDGSERGVHLCDTGVRPPGWLWLLLNVERALQYEAAHTAASRRAWPEAWHDGWSVYVAAAEEAARAAAAGS